MATLREIQLVELEMIKTIDDICNRNKIAYSLAWGTMLGAIRHKGFIPWDDDLDIYMKAEDVKVLKKELNSDKYAFQDNVSDIRTNFTFVKIRKNNTYMPQDLFEGMDIHQGIWVDIFCLYPGAKSVRGRKLQYRVSEIWQSFRSRYINVKNQHKEKLFRLLCVIPVPMQRAIDSILESLLFFLGNSKSGILFSPVNNTFERSFIPQKTLETRRYQFEDTYLLGPVDYDTYLKQMYGVNYMTPIRYGHDVDYTKVIV